MKVDTPVTGSVDEATSQTVDICRCLLILGIVCVHCQIEVPPDAPAWLHDFRYFFQVILPSVCVPGFFVISGCWFFCCIGLLRKYPEYQLFSQMTNSQGEAR